MSAKRSRSNSASTSITSRRCVRRAACRYPDPVHAALLAEQAGADNITLHLREDRRHIQDRDVHALRPLLQTRMNLEMGLTERDGARSRSACARRIAVSCRRTAPKSPPKAASTSPGDVERVAGGVRRLARRRHPRRAVHRAGLAQIEAAKRSGAPVIELHTGTYAEAHRCRAGARTRAACARAARNAPRISGSKSTPATASITTTWRPVAAIAEIVELNIGHCIIARAIFAGLDAAVRDMKALMLGGAAMIFGIGVDVLEAARIKKV